jgi:hypothetical protein
VWLRGFKKDRIILGVGRQNEKQQTEKEKEKGFRWGRITRSRLLFIASTEFSTWDAIITARSRLNLTLTPNHF